MQALLLCLVAFFHSISSQATLDCEPLSNPTNGLVTFDSLMSGSLANYSCSEGFFLVGARQRTCEDSGVWSPGMEPFCQPPISDHLFPFGELAGDQLVTPFLDGSSDLINVSYPFFGTQETPLYVSSNGVLSFRIEFFGFVPEIFPIPFDMLIAPFWDDSDNSVGGQVYYRVTQDFFLLDTISDDIFDAFGVIFVPISAVVATWNAMPQYLGSPDVVNTFQAVVATDGSATYAMFLYRDIQWGSSQTSVGFNAANGIRGFNLPQSFTNESVLNLEADSNVGAGPECAGVYIFRVDLNDTIQSPPEPIRDHLFPFGRCVGDTMVPPSLDATSDVTFKSNVTCPFFETEEDRIFVSTNGLISFRNEFTDFVSDPFPLVDFRSNEVLIAPFWDDSDNGQGGSVYYRLSSEPGLMDQIGANISGAFDVEFRPGSAFVATWNGLPQYLGPADVVNTFQAVVATNGSATYVMFLYRDIQWDSNRTSIGFNAGDGIRGFNLNNSFDDTFNLTVDLQRESNVAPEFPGVFMFRVDQEMVIQASDIDECAEGTHSCSPNAQCDNTDGSFTCTCLPGFSGDGFTCEDIDECVTMPRFCDEMCWNTPGSFECICLEGHTGDGLTCTDIDECSVGSHNCDSNAECVNLDRSFLCTCLSGFTLTEQGNDCEALTAEAVDARYAIGGAVSGVLIIAITSIIIIVVIAVIVRGRRARRMISLDVAPKDMYYTNTDTEGPHYELVDNIAHYQARIGPPPIPTSIPLSVCPAYASTGVPVQDDRAATVDSDNEDCSTVYDTIN